MKLRVIAVGLGALALVAPAGSSAGPSRVARNYRMSATMTPQQVVTLQSKPWKVPASVKNAKGSLTGTMPTNGGQITWRITFSGLGSPTVKVAAIHLGKPGQFGPVLAQLCSPCKSGAHGTATLMPGQSSQMSTGNAYVTLTTAKYPLGVVRGLLHALLSG
jgi:hypothetical protein